MKPSTPPSTTIKEQAAEELIANISQLMAEAEEMLSESTSQHAEETVELLRPGFYAEKRRRVTYASAKARVIDTAKRVDATIRTYPYESLLVALGVGALAGAFFSRRRT